MAVPSYATDLTDIYTDTGNFSTVGGGRVTDAETDDYIQGNNCWSHDPFSSGTEGGVHDTVTAETIVSGDAVFIWTKCDVAATLSTHAVGGISCLVGNSAVALKVFAVAGSDDYVYGGWKCYPVDPTKTPTTNIGSPSGVWDHFGVIWDVPSTGASKGYPMKIDAMRHGKKLEVTAGDSSTPATWDSTSNYDSTTTRQWGICQPTDSGAELQGHIYWGTASASVYSRDSNRSIVIIHTEWTDTDFTQIIFDNAGNDIVWDNISLKALGTNNRGIIDVNVNPSTNGISWTNSIFEGIDVTTLLSDCTFDGSKWLGTNAVTSGGASLLNCKILTPTVAQDTAALIWNVSDDTDGLIDGMEFSKGSNAHHAISFTDNTTVEYTLRNIDFSGFHASNANNDSALYFPDSGSDIDWIINTVSCSGDISYKKVRAGDTVTIVSDPVTLTFNIKDTSGNPINDARINIINSSTKAELYQIETNASGIATQSHVYTGVLGIEGWCRQFDISGTDYIPKDWSGSINTNGFTITIVLEAYN